MAENQESKRDNIMNRPALPSSTGTSPGFLGLQNARRLEEQHKVRKKLGAIVKTKVKFRSSNFSIMSSDESTSGGASSPWNSSISSEGISGVASPASLDSYGISSPQPSEEDNPESPQKKFKADKRSEDCIEKSESAFSVNVGKSGSLVSGDYESSGSDEG